MIYRDLIDLEIKRVLHIATMYEVGLSDVPSERPTTPYLIINWSPSPRPEGSMGNPQDMPYYDYVIKSVGRDHRETARASAMTWEAMTAQYGSGAYLYEFLVEGVTFVSRSMLTQGVIVRSEGPDLFEVNDIYRICLTGQTLRS